MKRMTVTEAKRLARKARTMGSFAVSSTIREYWCPLGAARDQQSHRIAVHHMVWDAAPSAAAIDKAFAEHYTARYSEDRCPCVPTGDYES